MSVFIIVLAFLWCFLIILISLIRKQKQNQLETSNILLVKTINFLTYPFYRLWNLFFLSFFIRCVTAFVHQHVARVCFKNKLDKVFSILSFRVQKLSCSCRWIASFSFFVQQFPLKTTKLKHVFQHVITLERNFSMCQWWLCLKHDSVIKCSEHQMRLVPFAGYRRCLEAGRKCWRKTYSSGRREILNESSATEEIDQTHEWTNRCKVSSWTTFHLRIILGEEILSRISTKLLSYTWWWRPHWSWLTRTTHSPQFFFL